MSNSKPGVGVFAHFGCWDEEEFDDEECQRIEVKLMGLAKADFAYGLTDAEIESDLLAESEGRCGDVHVVGRDSVLLKLEFFPPDELSHHP